MQSVIKQGMDKMYNLEFKEAQKYFIKVKEKYPENPAYDLLQAMSLGWEVTYNNTFKQRAEENLKYLDSTIEKAEKMLKKNANDPEGIFFVLAGRASIALYYSQTNQTSRAVNEARKAYSLIKKADELKDKMVDFYFPVGLYNYYVVQYPENHPIFKPFMIFFRSGNKQTGLYQLDYCSKHGVYSRTEATNYAGHIYLRYEENFEKSLHYTSQLVEQYPGNIYFKINHCEALIGNKQFKEAEYFAYDLYKNGRIYPRIASFTYYGLLNEHYFQKPDVAKTYYLQALNLAKKCEGPTQDFTGQCYAGLGRLADREGNIKQAREYYKKCLEFSDYLSLMKEAHTYLDTHD